MIKLNVKQIADKLANNVNSKAIYNETYNCYTIGNISEEVILNEGFIYQGLEDYHKKPLYIYENLLGVFDDNLFKLCEFFG